MRGCLNIMRRLFSLAFYKLVKILNCFINKKNRSLLFIPHKNCHNDNYDIINYTGDNALVLCHYFLSKTKFDGPISLVYYNEDNLSQYTEYIIQFGKDVSFVNGNSRWNLIKAFIKCNVCFTCDPHYNFSYKINKQKVICLGYFSPFKDDYHAIKMLSKREQSQRRKEINNSFSNHIVTSYLCGRIISLDTLLQFDKFVDIGYPRNDIFYSDTSKLKENILSRLGDSIKRVICYTPTYRDYERRDVRLSNNKMSVRKTIWGLDNDIDEEALEKLLKEKETVVIVKLHPWQEKSVLIDRKRTKHIVLFSELQKQYTCSLYDVLAISDCLITDYTSTAFDFMHMNRPIIYYMYDFEKYNNNRGFSFSPVTTICGGPIAYSFSELLEYLKTILDGEDSYSEKRSFIHNLINRYQDGNSSVRVHRFIESIE